MSSRIRWTSDLVLDKACEVHGDRYEYDLSEFRNLQSKIRVTCKIHGDFFPTAKNHVLNTSGCPGCFNDRRGTTSKGKKRPGVGGRKPWDKKRFIEEAQAVHGDLYDYSLVDYKNAHTKIAIRCPKHGVWEQLPHSHLKSGCKSCAIEIRSLDTDTFISRSKEAHNDRYDYSLVDYVSQNRPVTIICPLHGSFEQLAGGHLYGGHGCPKCGGTRLFTTEEVIEHFKKIHGGKYDYSKTKYVSDGTPVTITCKNHGYFEQLPKLHKKGHGCPKCMADANRNTQEDVIARFKLAHGDRYDYSKMQYVLADKKVTITCKEHGDFEQIPKNHWIGQGCPICSCITSKGEIEVYEFVSSLVGEGNVIQRDRSIIAPYELDIVIPEKKLAIEYCGLYWHSSEGGKDRNYHVRKHDKAEDAGYRLITIFEDEWRDKQEIVKSTLSHFLGCTPKGVFARKTRIHDIPWSIASGFLEKHHLLGAGQPGNYRIGAYHGDELVAVMVFGYPSDERGMEDIIEMKRFVTNGRNNPGVGSKMFKHAVDEKVYTKVIAFVDRRWFTGSFKALSGFVVDGKTQPTKYWTDFSTREQRRFKTKKSMIEKDGVDPNMTKKQMLNSLGYYPIYDCGKLRLVWEST